MSVERWALEVRSPDSRPVIACYCATFLKPEMLHIYRQITALERCRPVVIAQKREQAGRYPFEPISIVPKPATHFLRRFWFRQLRDLPWQISDRELRVLQGILSKTDARLLHIYFGQIAVHRVQLWRRCRTNRLVPGYRPPVRRGNVRCQFRVRYFQTSHCPSRSKL